MISLAYLATGSVGGRFQGDHQALERRLAPSRRAARRVLPDGPADHARSH